MLLFRFHAGNGSSVCQRLTLQREGSERGNEKEGKKGEGGEGRQKRNTKVIFEKRESESERNL